MRNEQLTKNFYLAEFTRSQTASRRGIVNKPSRRSVRNLRRLCQEQLQPLRDALGPVHVTSGYRCHALNRAIGGSPKSQHRDGLAADIVVSGHLVEDVAWWLHDHSGFDQLIHEFGEWVHVSVADPLNAPREIALTASFAPTGVQYAVGLPISRHDT